METAMHAHTMTTGRLLPVILRFSAPIFLSQLLQQFYNTADTMIVGRFLGVDALAAVGSTWALNYLIVHFCTGVGNGVGISVAQQYGAENFAGVRRCMLHAFYLILCVAVVLTTLTVCLCKSMQILTQTPDEILSLAYDYLVIIFAGLPCTLLVNFCFGVLMAIGDSKFPSIFMAISTVLNLGLDLLFIVPLQMSVSGAALATVLSQLIAGVCSLAYLLKRYSMFLPQKGEYRLHLPTLCYVAKMGVPMGLQYSITAFGAVMLQTSVNAIGTHAVAGFSAAYKIKGLFMCPIVAIGTALATCTGQNFGAKQFQRIWQGVRQTILVSWGYAAVVMVTFLLLCRALPLLFVEPTETEVIGYAAQLIVWLCFTYFELGVLQSVRFAVQGMGKSVLSLCSGLAEMIARVVFALFLIPNYGYLAVCVSEGVTFLSGALVIVPIYLALMHKLRGKWTSVNHGGV